MIIGKEEIKKIVKHIIFYILIVIAFILPHLIILKQGTLYTNLTNRILLLILIIYPLLSLFIAIICKKLRANIFIVISLTVIAFVYLAFKYMNNSALLYLLPYILIEGLTYFVIGPKRLRIKFKEEEKNSP